MRVKDAYLLGVTTLLVPADWQATLLREGLRRAGGLPGWFGGGVGRGQCESEVWRALTRTAPASEWAQALNHLADADAAYRAWAARRTCEDVYEVCFGTSPPEDGMLPWEGETHA